MIIYAVAPGKAPQRVKFAPGAAEMLAWLHATGHRAVWVMVDEGTPPAAGEPCCYGAQE